MAESSEKGLFLKPAVAYPIEIYSDSRVAEFDEEDKALGKYLNYFKSDACGNFT